MRKRIIFFNVVAVLVMFGFSSIVWAHVTVRTHRADVPYELNHGVDPYDSRAIVPYVEDSGATTYETIRGAKVYDDIMCRSRLANRCINQVCITSSLRHCTDMCRTLARDKCRLNRNAQF